MMTPAILKTVIMMTRLKENRTAWKSCASSLIKNQNSMIRKSKKRIRKQMMVKLSRITIRNTMDPSELVHLDSLLKLLRKPIHPPPSIQQSHRILTFGPKKM